MSARINRQVLLKSRPADIPQAEHFPNALVTSLLRDTMRSLLQFAKGGGAVSLSCYYCASPPV